MNGRGWFPAEIRKGKQMNAKEFKAQSEILMDKLAIDFVSKKYMLFWVLTFTDGCLDFIRDPDCHVYVNVGKTLYSDEEITPAILKKADYIEASHQEGYMFYLGHNADPEALQDAFDASIRWHIDVGLEFGELVETEDGRIIKAA